jgi:hypothetical protein
MSFKSTPLRITAQTRGSRRFQGIRPAFIRTLVISLIDELLTPSAIWHDDEIAGPPTPHFHTSTRTAHPSNDPGRQEGPPRGAFLSSSVMQFCSGSPMHSYLTPALTCYPDLSEAFGS